MINKEIMIFNLRRPLTAIKIEVCPKAKRCRIIHIGQGQKFDKV